MQLEFTSWRTSLSSQSEARIAAWKAQELQPKWQLHYEGKQRRETALWMETWKNPVSRNNTCKNLTEKWMYSQPAYVNHLESVEKGGTGYKYYLIFISVESCWHRGYARTEYCQCNSIAIPCLIPILGIFVPLVHVYIHNITESSLTIRKGSILQWKYLVFLKESVWAQDWWRFSSHSSEGLKEGVELDPVKTRDIFSTWCLQKDLRSI